MPEQAVSAEGRPLLFFRTGSYLRIGTSRAYEHCRLPAERGCVSVPEGAEQAAGYESISVPDLYRSGDAPRGGWPGVLAALEG